MFNNQILAAKLLETGAVRIQPDKPFTWASGLRSPIYCDNRILLSHPEIRTGLIDLMTKVAKDFEFFDTVAGVATAGIAHGALLADRLKMPFAYVRSKPKDHGRQNLIEGEIKSNAKVLVVEDLISTGMSSLQAVEAIRQVPANVTGVIAIFQYGLPIARDAFDNAECPFKTLTDFQTIIHVAADQKMIEPHHIELLNQWSANPQAWSAHYLVNN
ncbi:MAG: orotate phosphoribosyltransferase [Saprospiraceae bacterium]|uniref:Orotate phosphoribosyltransferase n=1 Tax=Candidatus Opimibacter skivensis TaxID=2982028 RepID=A0A9D7SS62_9BACT|nr:orotate phosphoribosyltransferase [Candidatus Opimibacter skivensis]